MVDLTSRLFIFINVYNTIAAIFIISLKYLHYITIAQINFMKWMNGFFWSTPEAMSIFLLASPQEKAVSETPLELLYSSSGSVEKFFANDKLFKFSLSYSCLISLRIRLEVRWGYNISSRGNPSRATMLHVKGDFRLQISTWSSIHGSEIDRRRPLPGVTDCKKMFNSFFTHQTKIKSKTHQFDQKSGILSSRRQLDASATLNLHPAIAEDISGVVSHYWRSWCKIVSSNIGRSVFLPTSDIQSYLWVIYCNFVLDWMYLRECSHLGLTPDCLDQAASPSMVHEVQVIEPDNARESQDHLATASAESESEATLSCPGSGSSAVSKFGSVTGSGMLQSNRIFNKFCFGWHSPKIGLWQQAYFHSFAFLQKE